MRATEIKPALWIVEGVNVGRWFGLEASQVTLGRDASCDIVLPLQTISRQHARVLREPAGIFIEDLGSLNGTLVNGERVDKRRRLRDGDRIEIHEVVLNFRERRDDEPSPVETFELSSTREQVRSRAMVLSSVGVLEAERRLEEDPQIKLRAILEIIRNAGTSLDIDDVLPKILESLFRIFPQASRGYVLLVDPVHGQLLPRAVKHQGSDSSGPLTLGPIESQLALRVMRDREAILSSEPASSLDLKQSVLDGGARSVMCAPLVAPSGSAVGVIQIDSESPQRQFAQQDLDVLASIALLVGQLVEYGRWHERRREEAALAQVHAATERERARLRAVLDILPVGVFIADAKGKLLETNRAAKQEWGGHAPLTEKPEDYSRDYKAWWPETGRRVESHEWGLARALAEGQECPAEELEIETARGTRETVLNYAVPILDEARQIAGGVAVLVNITERKRIIEALRDADKRKDEFLAMLAHELRNPLSPIRHALSLVRAEDVQPELIPWALEMMERQVDHMVRLVDDLLDVSRATQGKIKLRKERVEVARVVTHAVETARPLIDSLGHHLSVSLPPQPIWLEADEIRLEQVLANLLNNAAKYTDRGGRIWLSVEQQGDQVSLAVRDSGIGISAEVLPRIFDLFTQADRSLDRAHGGLGIGLSLVQKLVTLHGGTVMAFSEGPGRGSEFSVRLPVAEAPPPSAAQPVRVPAAVSRRILVVDDNIDGATTLAMMFQMWKHQVEVAHDGVGVLDLARQFRPELILLDIGLPGQDGYEVARQLRSDAEFAETLLVAITGYGQEDDRRRSDEAGFDLHLVKPVEARFLRELLAHPKLACEAVV